MKKFIIEHIDPLGQGVFKENDQIYFIPKTLPKETGTFEILKSKKGVNFGKLVELDKKSETRVEPECPHFNNCPGCHFLHTDYQSEIQFKLNSYLKLLKYLDISNPNVKIIESPQRLNYRNRIQLHYHIDAQLIGFKTAANKIVPVPNCKIMEPIVESAYIDFLKVWLSEAKRKKKKFGHVEIYNYNGQITISWNKAYAQGGFTQVNDLVNSKLQNEITNYFTKESITVLDLFGGAGNLSKNLKTKQKRCIDLYPDQREDKHFSHLDLFDDNALKNFTNKHSESYDTFIIDPPRSGFKNLKEWADHYNPKNIIYVSCHPATMTRDLKSLNAEYLCKSIYLIDLFPSTFHYESMIFLEKR